MKLPLSCGPASAHRWKSPITTRWILCGSPRLLTGWLKLSSPKNTNVGTVCCKRRGALLLQDAERPEDFCSGRDFCVWVHLPQIAGSRGGGRHHQVPAAKAFHCHRPPRPQSLSGQTSKCLFFLVFVLGNLNRPLFLTNKTGVCCEDGAAEASQSDPGSSGHWEDRHLRHHRLPPLPSRQRVGKVKE